MILDRRDSEESRHSHDRITLHPIALPVLGIFLFADQKLNRLHAGLVVLFVFLDPNDRIKPDRESAGPEFPAVRIFAHMGNRYAGAADPIAYSLNRLQVAGRDVRLVFIGPVERPCSLTQLRIVWVSTPILASIFCNVIYVRPASRSR